MFEDVEEIKTAEKNELQLHYYYNREERIARAAANVKEYYNGGMRPVRGFKVLFLRQNRWIFISLILFVVATWGYTGFNKTREYATIDGINFELSAFSYEEQIFTSLLVKKGKKGHPKLPANIKAEFFLIDPNNQITEKQYQSLIYSEGEQFIRVKFTDFDIIRVDVIVSIDGQEKELSAQVKR